MSASSVYISSSMVKTLRSNIYNVVFVGYNYPLYLLAFYTSTILPPPPNRGNSFQKKLSKVDNFFSHVVLARRRRPKLPKNHCFSFFHWSLSLKRKHLFFKILLKLLHKIRQKIPIFEEKKSSFFPIFASSWINFVTEMYIWY